MKFTRTALAATTAAAIAGAGTMAYVRAQNANYALDVSSHGYVLETGKVVLADKSEALRENPEVQNAYLGT